VLRLVDDVRGFIEETIIRDGLGIWNATREEVDAIMNYRTNALLSDYTLADMVSRRARIGVPPLASPVTCPQTPPPLLVSVVGEIG
jgi:hypothetical protein